MTRPQLMDLSRGSFRPGLGLHHHEGRAFADFTSFLVLQPEPSRVYLRCHGACGAPGGAGGASEDCPEFLDLHLDFKAPAMVDQNIRRYDRVG